MMKRLLLAANSPVTRVDKLQGPLLLAYGERDPRVPCPMAPSCATR